MSTEIIAQPNAIVYEIKVETLTLEQTAQIFRTAGIPTTSNKIGDGIEQGVYPFGVCIKGSGGSRKFQIFKRQLVEWLSERASQ